MNRGAAEAVGVVGRAGEGGTRPERGRIRGWLASDSKGSSGRQGGGEGEGALGWMWDEPGRAVERRSKRKKGGRGQPQEWKSESSAGVAALAAYASVLHIKLVPS